ncbi:MAG: tripartite tricarboxylate transporter substrate-binding protein, partial [Limisphaerales bacterium]
MRNVVRVLALATGLILCLFRTQIALAQTVTTEIPVTTNSWELANLQIVDKDVNGFVVNANDLYVKSIMASFPEITGLSDIIGKTDYDFYPQELADQFRADDAAVIAAGERWENIEVNQPIGGEASYVYVSKTPIRDDQNLIYALRIQFYQIPMPGQTVIPTPGSAWEESEVIIIDKDTNSVFINANPAFIATLTPSFPEIQSFTNLIGRDDYYFYPPEMAEKFRADDRQVLESGIPLMVFEDNQPIGGARTSAQVSKRPLRKPDGTIYGLRIIAWSLPEIQAHRADNTLELTFSKSAAAFFSLEHTTDIQQGATWQELPFSVLETGESVSVLRPATEVGEFFRLTHVEPVPTDWNPDRPITLVVPWAAGGSTDQLARLLAGVLSPGIGQEIIVVNHPGNSGVDGTTAVLHAPHDGYTWLAGAAADLGLYQTLGLSQTKLEDWTPFLPISLPQVYAVGSQSPYQNFDQLMAGFRDRPGELRVGSAGLSSAGRIAIELLRQKTGIEFIDVFYNGGIEVAAACAAGEIDVMAQAITDGVELMRSGQIRPLATLADTQLEIEGLDQPILPVNQWIPELSATGNYFGIFLTQSTPSNVVNAVQEVWDTLVPDSLLIEEYARTNGASFNPVSAASAQAATAGYIQ